MKNLVQQHKCLALVAVLEIPVCAVSVCISSEAHGGPVRHTLASRQVMRAGGSIWLTVDRVKKKLMCFLGTVLQLMHSVGMCVERCGCQCCIRKPYIKDISVSAVSPGRFSR
jgi:hypothetical protein